MYQFIAALGLVFDEFLLEGRVLGFALLGLGVGCLAERARIQPRLLLPLLFLHLLVLFLGNGDLSNGVHFCACSGEEEALMILQVLLSFCEFSQFRLLKVLQKSRRFELFAVGYSF